jgi:alpha-amylase
MNEDNTCNNGWICEHRWRQIYNMVAFKNRAIGTNVELWQSNGRSQIGFCRGAVGFVAFNNENTEMRQKMQTRMAPGDYCDIISGTKSAAGCTGKVVTVDEQGMAAVEISPTDEDGVVAIYVDSKV